LRAAQGFFRAFSQGIKNLVAELTAAIAKTLVFRAILTALGGNPASFVTVLGSFLGVPTAGGGSSSGGGVGSHLTAGPVSAAALRGPPQPPQNIRVEIGGAGIRNGELTMPLTVLVDGYEAGLYEKRRDGSRT